MLNPHFHSLVLDGTWCTGSRITSLRGSRPVGPRVAATSPGIATLECYFGYSFLECDDAEEGVELRESGELDAEHWMASFQWRISKPESYAGYPD